MTPITVAIAEDMALMRHLLTRQLGEESDIEIVGEATNGEEAVNIACQRRPQVILMDLEMPVMNGVQATERINREYPATRVVLLTSHEQLASVGRLAGAVDALAKNCTPAELTGAIRRAAGDKAAEKPALPGHTERIITRYHLTEREGAVLEKLVDAGLTRQQIARALSREWRQTVTDSAVKHAQERILAKVGLEPRTRAALIKFVLQTG